MLLLLGGLLVKGYCLDKKQPLLESPAKVNLKSVKNKPRAT